MANHTNTATVRHPIYENCGEHADDEWCPGCPIVGYLPPAPVGRSIRWSRLCAGEYRAQVGPHRFEITHRETPDLGDGYGRRDDWVLVHTGPTGDPAPFDVDYLHAGDPVGTLWEAKACAESIVRLAVG